MGCAEGGQAPEHCVCADRPDCPPAKPANQPTNQQPCRTRLQLCGPRNPGSVTPELGVQGHPCKHPELKHLHTMLKGLLASLKTPRTPTAHTQVGGRGRERSASLCLGRTWVMSWKPRSRLHDHWPTESFQISAAWWHTLISFMKIKILNHKASHSFYVRSPPTCLFFTEKGNRRPGKGGTHTALWRLNRKPSTGEVWATSWYEKWLSLSILTLPSLS